MYTQWMLDTHGDPLGAVRRFIQLVWQRAQLDGLLAPVPDPENTGNRPQFLHDPAQLSRLNPFKPLMTVNEAKLLPELLRSRPNDRLGAVLRPCEMRALVEMVKHAPFKIDHLLTIGIDCLGTYPVSDFEWRRLRKSSSQKLVEETIQFARQGGIVAYRYRSACQACVSAVSQEADLNLGIIGLPVRQVILVTARDSAAAQRYQLDEITDGAAGGELIAQRERVLAKMAERHQRTRDRLIRGLNEVLPSSVDALLQQFENCGPCQNCMSNCPICEVDPPQRGVDGRYVRKEIERWLISCAGCGMCEQNCPNHLPLSVIFANLRGQLAEPFGYRPGHAIAERLPIA